MAVDERHDVVQHPIDVARIEERQNVWMLKISGELDLTKKSFSAECGATFRVEDLERDASMIPDVFRGVDGRHTASADDALDAIPLGEQCSFWEGVVGHALR